MKTKYVQGVVFGSNSESVSLELTIRPIQFKGDTANMD